MELCLVGLFFLVRDAGGNVACKGQGICMVVVLVLTIGYQILLNEAFDPLIQYLPITLEDDAVKRDEQFQRAQFERLGLLSDIGGDSRDPRQSGDSENNQDAVQKIELSKIDTGGSGSGRKSPDQGKLEVPSSAHRQSWADRTSDRKSSYNKSRINTIIPNVRRMRDQLASDCEAQTPQDNKIGRAMFAGVHEELEDLTPDEREVLVRRAFQHEALRAKRPVIWIPQDETGVSDDEIYRTQRFSKHIWISNEYQALDGKCRTIFSRSPPDFSEVDLIHL